VTTSPRVVGSVLLVAAVAAVAFLLGRTSAAREVPSTGNADSSGIHRIAGGSYEASGLAAVPGDSQFLFVDDGREREIFLLALSSDGLQMGNAIALPFPADVTDMEGITTDGRFFYVVGSQSKKTGFDGDGLLRFTFDPQAQRIAAIERIQGLKSWLADNVAELRGTGGRFGDDVLNIEGLAWDPTNRRLLLGLRAPLAGDSALVVPIRLADSTRAFTIDNLTVDGATLRLALGGAGIRGIEWDSVTGAFLVIVGASLDDENRDFRVVEWNGRSGSQLRQIATYDRRLKPEGIARATIAGNPSRVVVFDVGHVAVMRE
jgi:Protein of unknown function (DUF3616)